MNEIIIRKASKKDFPTLAKLYTKFHKFYVKRVVNRFVSPSTTDHSALYSAFEKIINSDDAVIFVAEIESQLVGLSEVYVRQDEPNPLKVSYRYGYLQSMIVTESFRGKGIGKKLLVAAEGWTKEQNAAEMRLNTWEFGEGPLRFYEKHGYRTLRRTLVRKLKEN